MAPFLPDDQKLAAVREGLPATGAGIYLNTGSVGPLPRETARAMAEITEWEIRTGRAHPDIFADTLERMDEARAAVAAILAAEIDSIALTHAATDGLNIASWAVDWRAGDRAITTTLEHAGALGPLYTLRDRLGVDLMILDLGDGGDDERTLAAFDAAITPRTKLVSLSHVSWSTGAVLPLARVVELAHARGALVLIDGAQAAGAIAVDVAALGVDFYAVSAQKWLLGPDGMGALYCAPAVLERAQQTFAGWYSYEALDSRGSARSWPTARRFEASNYHRASIVGMARSCGWLSMFIGLDWIHRRGTSLARRAAERLAAIPGVEMLTPIHQMATLVTFRIRGWPSDQALDELGRRVFSIARTIPGLDAIRISVGFFNTDWEVDRFCETVEELARHTPDTLPPSPSLTILGQGGG